MSTTPFSTRRLCCHLRWRELPSALDTAAPEGATPCSDEGCFWCTHTRGHLGPDGRVADEGSCRSGRECYEAACPPEVAALEGRAEGSPWP